MTYENMKIEVSETQPLEEIVKELELIGYKPYQPGPHLECAYTWDDGFFCLDKKMDDLNVIYKLTTLEELRTTSHISNV